MTQEQEKEKLIYNKAITRAANLVKSYDGLIPNDFERQVIVDAVLKLKRKIGRTTTLSATEANHPQY